MLILQRATAVTALLLALTAADAAATTVKATTDCSPQYRVCRVAVDVKAAPGEVNDMTIGSADGVPGYKITDATAFITDATGCDRIDEHSVRCGVADGGITLSVDLGDGDDSISTPDSTDLVAGSGNDTIRAHQLSYRDHTAPVTVDLAAGTGGSPGERDTLIGVVDLTGTGGNDTLRGSGGADQLNGADGDDVIDARAGFDSIEGGAGRDRIDAGIGNDSIDSQDPKDAKGSRNDTVVCGLGGDFVGGVAQDESHVDPGDLLAPDCERAEWPRDLVVAQPKVTTSAIVLRLRAPTECNCRGTFTVRSGRRVIASGSTGPKAKKLVAPLNRAGRRLLARSGPHDLRLTWRKGRTTGGHVVTVGG